MSKKNQGGLLQRLRGGPDNPDAVRVALKTLRLEVPPEQLGILVAALRRTKPRFMHKYGAMGKQRFADLCWERPLIPLALKDELAFAAAWLCPYSQGINLFLRKADLLQTYFLKGELETAAAGVRSVIETMGWSFWATELEFGLLQLLYGDDVRKTHSQRLRESARPRLASLVAQVINDRNDSLISLESFVSKCNDIFPRLGLEKTTEEYLSYRASGRISDLPESMANILATDIFNSLPDYYESFVDACASVAIYSKERATRSAALDATDQLCKAGFSDHRLAKIRTMLGSVDVNSYEQGEGESVQHLNKLKVLLLGGDVELSAEFMDEYASGTTLSSIASDIRAISTSSLKAENEITRLTKLGATFGVLVLASPSPILGPINMQIYFRVTSYPPGSV